MKKLQLMLLLTVFLNTAFSSNYDDDITKKGSSFSGKVIDKKTGEPLTGVSVKLTGLNLTVYTDFDGNFSVNNIFPGKYDVAVTMLSYKNVKKEKIPVDLGKTNYLKIELESMK